MDREEGHIRLGLQTEPDGWFVIRQGGGMGLAIIHSILPETTRLDHFTATNTEFGVCFEIRAHVKSA